MNQDATAKIRMLKRSRRCFIFGLLALLPALGLPFALAALWISGSVRKTEKQFWNAAKPYRIWGAVCAAMGTILWGGLIMFVIFQILLSTHNFN